MVVQLKKKVSHGHSDNPAKLPNGVCSFSNNPSNGFQKFPIPKLSRCLIILSSTASIKGPKVCLIPGERGLPPILEAG